MMRRKTTETEDQKHLRALAHQILFGCNALECDNRFCCRSKNFQPLDCDFDSMLVQLLDMHNHGQKVMCIDTLPRPLFMPDLICEAGYLNGQVRVGKIEDDFFAKLWGKPLNICYFGVSDDGLFTVDDLQLDELFYDNMDYLKREWDALGKQKVYRRNYERVIDELLCQKPTFWTIRGMLNVLIFDWMFEKLPIEKSLKLVEAMVELPGSGLEIVFNALIQCPIFIRVLASAVNRLIISENDVRVHTPELHQLCSLLQVAFEANQFTTEPLAPDTFINENFTARIYPEQELRLHRNGIPSYLDVPCILTSRFKGRVLYIDSLSHGVNNMEFNRADLLNSFCEQMFGDVDLRQLLVVSFSGQKALDRGGVSREFFFLTSTQVFDSQAFRKENGIYCFKEDWALVPGDARMIRAAGRIFRLALSSGVQLPIAIPLYFFKLLKGEALCTSDYAELFPEQAQNLKRIRDTYLSGDTDMELYFEVTTGPPEARRDEELIKNGRDTLVTKDNVDSYIEKWIEWHLLTSSKTSVELFKEGFGVTRRRSPDFFAFLTAYDMRLLLQGEQNINWEDLRNQAGYINCGPDSPPVISFWEAFMRLDGKQKLKMLQFITGTPGIPLEGMFKITIEISYKSQLLPTASTCILRLVIPDISDVDNMYAKLLICTENCEGFGFI